VEQRGRVALGHRAQQRVELRVGRDRAATRVGRCLGHQAVQVTRGAVAVEDFVFLDVLQAHLPGARLAIRTRCNYRLDPCIG